MKKIQLSLLVSLLAVTSLSADNINKYYDYKHDTSVLYKDSLGHDRPVIIINENLVEESKESENNSSPLDFKVGVDYASNTQGSIYGVNLGVDKMYLPFNNGFEIGFGGNFDILTSSSSLSSYNSGFLAGFKGIIGYYVQSNPLEFKLSYGSSFLGESLSDLKSIDGYVLGMSMAYSFSKTSGMEVSYRQFSESNDFFDNGIITFNFIIKPF